MNARGGPLKLINLANEEANFVSLSLSLPLRGGQGQFLQCASTARFFLQSSIKDFRKCISCCFLGELFRTESPWINSSFFPDAQRAHFPTITFVIWHTNGEGEKSLEMGNSLPRPPSSFQMCFLSFGYALLRDGREKKRAE